MTDIIRDPFNASNKELAIAIRGDRDLVDGELRRLGDIEDFKLDRLGDSLYSEGFITSGLTPTIANITNVLSWSSNFGEWDAVNGAVVTPAVAPNRHGELTASRLASVVGQDAYIELPTAVDADGRVVVSIDMLIDTTAVAQLVLFDGVAEVAGVSVTLTSSWQRVTLTYEGAYSVGATVLTARVRATTGMQPGTVLIDRAQMEIKEVGDALVAGRYVATAGAPVTEFGNVVAFEAGSVYIKGLPRPYEAVSITLDPLLPSGQTVIYAEMAELYLEGLLYESLENPYNGEPGNDSVREQTALRLTDTTNATPTADPVPTNPQYRAIYAMPVLQFDHATGVITPVVERSQMDVSKTIGQLDGKRVLPQSIPDDRFTTDVTEQQPTLTAALARRLGNQSGDFVATADGTDPVIGQDLTVTGLVKIKVDPLDGYVGGRPHYLTSPSFVTTPLQTSTAQRLNENHTFYTGYDTYKLAKPNVVNVDDLAGIFEVTEIVTRGPVGGGSDELSNQPVYQVMSVVQDSTTFVVGPGGDCVQSGDTIDWSLSGVGTSEPAAGSSYTVTYRYTRSWPADEFDITDANGVPTLPGSHITFTGANRPVDTLPFEVEYDYGQGRVDLLYLGPDGLAIAQGMPSDHPAPPPVARGTMALWEVAVAYGVLAVTFTPRFNVSIKAAELADMRRDIAEMRYNIAQIATNLELRDRNANLKNVIVDPFLDDRQFDTEAAFLAGVGERAARLQDGSLVMARDTDERRLTVDQVRTTLALNGEWAGLPYASVARITQNAYSSTESVNPFSNVALIPPLITLSTSAWGVRRKGPDPVFTRVTVRGSNFTPNEAAIPIKLDGQLQTTATANASGAFSVTFTVESRPQGVVTAEGATGTPQAVVSSKIRWPRRDPLAQVMVPPEDGFMTYVDLWFTGRSPTEPVIVSLRETQSGFPNEEVIALVTLQPTDVFINGSPTRITWPQPPLVDSGVGYAVVAASDSGLYRLQLGQLGRANLGPDGGFITTNPYGQGVMLASSDGRTWTAYQDSDLRFAMAMAKFEAEGWLYAVSESYPGGVTSFRLDMQQQVLFGANIVWQYSIDAEVSWVPFDPDREVALPVTATTLVIRARATTTKDYAGVIVDVENLVLMAYKADIRSSYVSIQKALYETTVSAKGYIKAIVPPGTNAPAFATNDNGATWVAGVLVGSTQLDANIGLSEFEYTFTFGSPGSAFRGRTDLTATDPTTLPSVQEAAFIVL